jgi:hypothetical protein
MGHYDPIIVDLNKLFSDWVFTRLDSTSSSRGIITRLSSNCTLTNCFSIPLGLCTEITCKELDRTVGRIRDSMRDILDEIS